MMNDNRQRQLLKRRGLFSPFLLLLVSLSIQAQMSRNSNRAQEVKNFNQSVSSKSKTTYIELIRKVFPGRKS
jgi:hypothetical protein